MKSTNGIGLALIMGMIGIGVGYFLRARSDSPVPPTVSATAGSTRTIIKGGSTRVVEVTNEFRWTQLESEDYRTYIARLRAIGCPEQTIHDIVIADLDKLFAPRVQAIYGPRKERQYWRSEEEELENNFDPRELSRKSREIDHEKRAVIQELLGTDLVRERMKQAGQEDYYERRLSFLPEEKRNQVRAILDFYDEEESKIAGKEFEDAEVLSGGDRSELRRLRAEEKTRIASVLTPTELAQYDLWLSPTANSVRHAFYGMDATEQEFLVVFNTRKTFDDVWAAADPVMMDETTRARMEQTRVEMEGEIRRQLGEQRYLEYKRGEDEDFHRLNATVSRYQLPREKAAEVSGYKRMLEAMRSEVQADTRLNDQQKQAALQAMSQETRKVVATSLGQKAFRYYEQRGDGAWLKN